MIQKNEIEMLIIRENAMSKKNDMKNRYLSNGTVIAQGIYSKLMMLVGGVNTGLFAIAVVMSFTMKDEKLKEGAPVYISLMFLFAIPLLLGIRKGRLTDTARRYETIFASDRDGVVTLEELATQTGKNGKKVFAELEKLFRKGYFRGCTLQRGGEPCVIIKDAMEGESGVGFASVTCRNCGAVTRIRAGSRGKCNFCGAPIADSVE